MNLNVRTEKVKRGKNTTNSSCGKTHKIPLDNSGGAWYNKRKHLKFYQEDHANHGQRRLYRRETTRLHNIKASEALRRRER